MAGWTVGSWVRRGGAGWLAGVALVMGVVGGCRDKDPVCDELTGLSCPEVGLQNEYYSAMCDECGTLWVCSFDDARELEVRQPKWPGCECIDDNGCLITSGLVKGVCGGEHGTYDTYDTGPPSDGECDSD